MVYTKKKMGRKRKEKKKKRKRKEEKKQKKSFVESIVSTSSGQIKLVPFFTFLFLTLNNTFPSLSA